jgi:nucleoside 2-deoxyribosyltransferase
MALFALIRAEYEAQVARGQIAPTRQPRYAALLDEVERIVSTPAPDIAALQVKSRRIQEMLAGFSAALMDPSRPLPVAAPAEGSRAALLLAQLRTLHAYVMAEIGDNQLTGDSGTALADLVNALHRCREALATPMSDADLTKFEVESLRPLALAVREFSLREHLALADPAWPSPVVAQHPGAVFYAGGDQVHDLVRQACVTRELRVLVPQRHKEPASLRWNQLREASIAVFDFTAWERAASPDVTAPVASVAYEFGIALALGRPVVIVSDARRGLPFDLDIDPVPVQHDDGDASRVADAIDHTLYGLQRGHAGSSVGDALTSIRRKYGDSADMRVRVSIASLADDLAHDPVKARLVASSILSYLGADGPQLLWPTWPAVSPDPQAPSCFHVTAFGPLWARQTRDIVRTACPPGVTYVRGDQALDPDIIRSIWDEICGATHIVVDLTGLNANVLVELGMAHALGRNVLLISQDAHPEHYFRALAKHRIHLYALDTPADADALREHVAAFVGRPAL